MTKIKVVFLGSRPLGFFALQQLMQMPEVDVVGCVVKKPPQKAWWVEDPFGMTNLPIISHDDLDIIDFDLGVSINYWRIIEGHIIKKPRLGFVNLHHSYMLSLRGRDMTTHAIINARPLNRWYHGTTFHYTDDGLDTGPIFATDSCSITETDTAWTLFQKVEAVGKSMLDLWLPRIVAAHPPLAFPQADQPLNLRSDATRKTVEDLFADPLLSYDITRAYDFNGHYEPASTIINGRKTFLTTRRDAGEALVLDAGEGRRIYEFGYSPPAPPPSETG